MTSTVASRVDQTYAQCVADWYVQETDALEQEIISTISEYSDYEPHSVILAVIERECGRLGER